MLAEVIGKSTPDVDAHIAELVGAGILLADDNHTYTFKHALIQEAAAASLVRRTRSRLHGDIVDALTRSFPQIVADDPARLAHHCVEAGRHLDAIGHYRRAAGRAAHQYANHEAAELLRRALEEYRALDPADRSPGLEIELRAEYGGPLAGVHGLLGDAVIENYRRLEILEASSTDVGERLGALLTLTPRYTQVSEIRALMDAGSRLLDVAATLEMPMFSAVGHMMSGLGATSIDADESLAQLAEVERLAAEGHLPGPFTDYAPDLLVLALGTKAIVLTAKGRIDEARYEIERTRRRAFDELAHPFSMGTAGTLAATIHVWLHEPELALDRADWTVEHARRYGFSNFESMCQIQAGWARTVLGGDGSDEIREGIKMLATSTMSSFPHQMRVAAMESRLRGVTAEARDYLADGIRDAERTGEDGHLPPLYIVDGLVAADEGRIDDAMISLRLAYDISEGLGQWFTGCDAACALVSLAGDDVEGYRALAADARAKLVGGGDVLVVRVADAMLS